MVEGHGKMVPAALGGRRKVTIRPEQAIAAAFERVCDEEGVSMTALLESFMEHTCTGELSADSRERLIIRARRLSADRRRGRPMS